MNQNEFIDGLLNIDLDLVMEDIMQIAKVLDSNYQDKPSNYYMKHIHLSNLDAQTALLSDLINWLTILGFSDGDFSIVEVEFIKRYLRLDMPSFEIVKFAHGCLKSGFLDAIPISLIIFMEDDNVMNKIAAELGDSRRQNFASKLMVAFQALGLQFIYCDGKVEDNEIELFVHYIEDLRLKMSLLDIDDYSEQYRLKIKNELGL